MPLGCMVVAALVLVPLAAGRPDVPTRAMDCAASYRPACEIYFSVTPASVSPNPAENAPHLNGGIAKWKINPSDVGDGCSVTNPIVGIVGPNRGQPVSQSRVGSTLYVSYTGKYAGTDRVQISLSVSGCNGWVYHVFVNGTTLPYQTLVGWGNDLSDTGGCHPSKRGDPLKGVQSYGIFRRQCVEDPVSGGLGAYTAAVTDVGRGWVGVPVSLPRTYTTGDARAGDLGYGWREPYDATLSVNTGVTPNTATASMGSGQQIVFTKQTNGSWLPPIWTTATLSFANSLYTLTEADHVKWNFDTAGALRSVVDRNGKGLTIGGGNPVGFPTSVTTSDGRIVRLTYHWVGCCYGQLTAVTLPDGRSVSYTYDTNNNLATVTDLRGGITRYTYDTYHRLLTAVDPRGHTVVTNVYGDYGRLVQQTDALGRSTTYTWTPGSCTGDLCTSTNTATATDPRGNVWIDAFTPDGLLARQVDPLGNATSYGYDPSTRDPLSITDALGNIVQFQYDARHNVTQTTLPGSITTSATYTTSGDLSTATNGRNYTTSYGYDTAGNPTLVTKPGGVTIGFTYNPAGQVATVTDEAGKTTTDGYDTPGNLASTTSPLGNKWSYGYDSSGRRISIIDPRGNAAGANPNDYKSTIAYNAADQIASTTDPLGHTTTFAYDADGNLTSRTDADNHQWQYSYDAANELIQVVAPDTTTTTYAYDAAGNVTTRTDANNHTTTYTYDAANRLIGIFDGLNRHWVLGYDADSNLVSVATPSGGTISYGYDSLGRLTSKSYSDATPTVTFSYDADGNRATMIDGAGTVNYTYNSRDQLTQLARGTDGFTYTYDPVGRVDTRTYPDSASTNYTYNDEGRIASATSGGNTSNYTYDPAGELTQAALPNGVSETYSRDHAGQVTQLYDGFRTFAYGYDAGGNVTSRSIDGTATTYGYDSLDRLINVTGSTNLTYGYDAVGNRTSQVGATGTTTSSFDAADQLQSVIAPGGTTSYSFDANGNETTAGTWTYAFNLASRLTSASNGSATVAYTYDGDGNRLNSTVGGTTTNDSWDSNFTLPQLALERDSSGSPLRRYIYGEGRISMTTPTTTAYYNTDAIGSVTEMSSGSGALLGQYDRLPFGDNATSSNVDPSVAGSPHGFAGEYQDPNTGLYDLRARQYDPQTARFISPDPLGPQGAASNYAYVANNPLGFSDPSGLSREPTCNLLCIIGGVVAGDPKGFAGVAGCYIGANALMGYGGLKVVLMSRAGTEFGTGFWGVLSTTLDPVHKLQAVASGGVLSAVPYYICWNLSQRLADGISP
jgi:RHS repeat-associated protein